ncbi:MAG TPA: polysaccharide biosynthesis protein [Methanofastidiosum sp.]|nr:polysaccharide biosynthesis protein [Methanofastidiosum sp.]
MSTVYWKNLNILITGGTGSLGKTLVKEILKSSPPSMITIFSRNEYKQWEMKKEFKDYCHKLEFIIGDVRDYKALSDACYGINMIFDTAAIKHVPVCEDNPLESIKTNIEGSINLVNAAIENKVESVIHINTDKAVYPISNYGLTKALAERIILSGNHIFKNRSTSFTCIRFGNFIGSQGSVIPLFIEQAREGKIIVTDPRMTRFFITLEDAAKFCIKVSNLNCSKNDIYIPKMKMISIGEVAECIKDIFGKPGTIIEHTHERPREKIYEDLISDEEIKWTQEFENYYLVRAYEELQLSRTWGINSNPMYGTSISFEKEEFIEILKKLYLTF